MPQNMLTINNTLINPSSAGLSTVSGAGLAGIEELLRGLTGWENTAANVQAHAALAQNKRYALAEAQKQFYTAPNASNRWQYADLLNKTLAQTKAHQHYCEEQQQKHQALLNAEQTTNAQSPSYFMKFSKLVVNGMSYVLSEERTAKIEDFLLKSDHTERIETYEREATKQQKLIDNLEQELKYLNNKIQADNEQNTATPPQASHARRLLSNHENVTVINPVPDQLIEPNVPYRYCLDGNEIFSGNSTLLLKVDNRPTWLTTHALVISETKTFIAMDVAVENNIAFVADLAGNFQTVDITDPSNPTVLGNYQTPHATRGVFPQNNTVFLAGSESGVYILDITNAANPILLSNYNTPGLARDLVVKNNIAFVADDSAGLQIIDVNNLAAPVWLGNHSTADAAYSIFVQGNIAFVAAYTAGLEIMDVSNYANPILLGSYNTPGWAVDIIARGNTVFVADRSSGLQIIDVSNLASPVLISNQDTPTWVYGVSLQGNMAFLADADLGVEIVDVSNPTNPVFLSRYDLPGDSQAVTLQNNIAFVASYASGLQIFKLNQVCLAGTPLGNDVGIATPTLSNIHGYDTPSIGSTDEFVLSISSTPKRADTSLRPLSTFPDSSLSLELNSALLFNDVDQQFLRLHANLENTPQQANWLNLRHQPTLLGSHNTLIARSVFIEGNRAFVADDGRGLQILDISDPIKPTSLNNYFTAGYNYDVVVKNNIAFLAYWHSGLQIVDVTDSAAPVWLGAYDTPGNARKVTLNNNMALIADGLLGLQIIDVNNPANPIFLGAHDTPGEAFDVVVLNSAAIVADGYSGLQIIDVSDPLNPALLNSYDTLGAASGLFLQDTTLFLANGPSGLHILNVNDPANPILLGSHNTPAYAYSVAVQSHTAFVADFSGLYTIDVSNPAHPFALGSYPTDYDLYDVAVQGNTALAANALAGIQILSLSDWKLTITPNISHVGNHVVRVTVTDELGAKASDTFSLRVEGPPQFTAQIPQQYAKVGQTYTYFIPQGLVVDPNFDIPSFNAVAEGRNNLLPWLSFNGISATFAGTPQSQHVDNITITVLVTDNVPGTPVVTQNFSLYIDHLPTLNRAIAQQVAPIDSLFQLTLDALTFIDADGDVLLYNAREHNQANLPAWLSFDSNTGTFSALPSVTQAGIWPIIVAANDPHGGYVETEFNLIVEYAPRPMIVIPTQLVGVNRPFVFPLDPDTFTDQDNQLLSYHIDQNNSAALPNFLSFNRLTLILSGTPLISDLGDHILRVIAQDSLGAAASTSFLLQVAYFPEFTGNVPTPPVARAGTLLNFSLPNTLFNDIDDPTLSYSATLGNGNPLPNWLNFDSNSLTFSGTPGTLDEGTVELIITARDSQGSTAEAPLSLMITPNFAPQLQTPLSTQTAEIESEFNFFVPSDTFIDPNDDTLIYRATLLGGAPLPNWLHFHTATIHFLGTPGRGDTNTYADRILEIDLSANDGIAHPVHAVFNINVQGASWIETMIKIGIPTFSALCTAYGFYKKRSILLNRCNKDQYQKLTQTIQAGEVFQYPLETERDNVCTLTAKRPHLRGACTRLFRSPRQTLEGGFQLPHWMEYDRSSNTLRSKECVPDNAHTETLTIQVKGRANIMLEQFELHIQGKELEMDATAFPDHEASDVELTSMQRVSHT